VTRALAVVFALLVFAGATAAATFGPPPPRTAIALGGGASALPSSWVTSRDPAVRSQFRRLARMCAVCSNVVARRLARPDFSMVDLASQARRAVAGPDSRYITIEPGVRDLCSGTPLRVFRRELGLGLAVLSTGGRRDWILVTSIEDLAGEWTLTNRRPCGLGATPSAAQLAALRERAVALNRVLAEVCFAHSFCMYDRGARFTMRLRPSYFSNGTLTVAGQRAIAAAEWPAARSLLSQGY
jgi:hypothetical protein